MRLASGEDDWMVTPHGRFLGEVLAEADLVEGREVLELGAGLGNHTVVMARQEPKRLVATEIHEDLLATTQANLEHNLQPDELAPVELRVADWLDTEGRFDVLVTNPPFAKSGKQNRRYFIDALILDAHKRLRPEGDLVFVQSSMADLDLTQAQLERNGFDHEVLAQRTGEFRDYYFEDETFMEEIQSVPDGFEVRDGTYFETLTVLRATLQPYTPPAGAHVV